MNPELTTFRRGSNLKEIDLMGKEAYRFEIDR
eukprot:CAMPEP_0196801024 /NCGR_PEP_ID=MMETSP1362-20130617/648_1 /TAXON_ID=163516 /ORGANISM="Leptocylindrus danicus, Strain CCMP1856" /LENGTH=31 /DNA_ID= /DNA_START= /DNA_END= /DNA_ORIENTATION=